MELKNFASFIDAEIAIPRVAQITDFICELDPNGETLNESVAALMGVALGIASETNEEDYRAHMMTTLSVVLKTIAEHGWAVPIAMIEGVKSDAETKH